jgi:GT2 family glycosyltransferase
MNCIDLSISIVSYNDKAFMRCFLNSIYQYIQGVTFEVLVVNNGTEDGVVQMIKDEFPQVDLVVNTKNVFFTKATNQNLARAKGEFVVYLSSDTKVSANTFAPMIALMRENSTIGVTGPVIYDFDGQIHSPGQMFPSVYNTVLELTRFHKAFPMNSIWIRRHYRNKDPFQTFDVESVSGACLMTRRSVLEKIGLLDEELVMFYDEHDFCRRVRKHGWRGTHCGKAEIWHFGHGTCRKSPSDVISRLMEDSFLYLHRKYFSYPVYLGIGLLMHFMQVISRVYQAFKVNLNRVISYQSRN